MSNVRTMPLRLHNTLTRNKETFAPLAPPAVGMYTCGPTVYGPAHIGNLRAYVFADTLRRALEWNNYEVTQVVNITDVGHLTGENEGNPDEGEDKMMKGLRREGLPVTLAGMKELAEKYARAFESDIAKLNIEPPHVVPRASEHIAEQIELIEKLEAKGATYATRDGLYFDISKFPEYGTLGGSANADESRSRIGEHPEKRNPADFALWKFSTPAPHAAHGLGWESPWGRGFPGWHIECSAMSMKYLGETLDIHTGGIDHIPIHHTNEIAQSETATGKPFARFWLHGAFLTIAGEKAAKSAGNTFYLSDLESRGIPPLAYRYWLLTAHYRSPVNFTWKAVEAAYNAYERLLAKLRSIPDSNSQPDTRYSQLFTNFINDDLDTPAAVALLWDMLKDPALSDAVKKSTALAFDKVLGLRLDTPAEELAIPPEVQALVTEREQARQEKNWPLADELRKKINNFGFAIEDKEEGYKVEKI